MGVRRERLAVLLAHEHETASEREGAKGVNRARVRIFTSLAPLNHYSETQNRTVDSAAHLREAGKGPLLCRSVSFLGDTAEMNQRRRPVALSQPIGTVIHFTVAPHHFTGSAGAW